MDYRHAHVLKGLVEEYIRTARPVGSVRLVEVLRLDVSPATMRNMLRDLEVEGYVEQPHTSAGRIPTDRGYRYYVDCLVFREPTPTRVQRLQSKYEQYQQNDKRPAKATARLLAEIARSLAVSGWMASRDIHGAGMSKLFEQDADEIHHTAREISVLLDNVDTYIDQYARDISQQTKESKSASNVQVYIGEENPVYKTKHTSVLVRSARLQSGEEVVLLLVEPKRMPYRKNVSLLDSVASMIEHS